MKHFKSEYYKNHWSAGRNSIFTELMFCFIGELSDGLWEIPGPGIKRDKNDRQDIESALTRLRLYAISSN